MVSVVYDSEAIDFMLKAPSNPNIFPKVNCAFSIDMTIKLHEMASHSIDIINPYRRTNYLSRTKPPQDPRCPLKPMPGPKVGHIVRGLSRDIGGGARSSAVVGSTA